MGDKCSTTAPSLLPSLVLVLILNGLESGASFANESQSNRDLLVPLSRAVHYFVVHWDVYACCVWPDLLFQVIRLTVEGD